MSTFNAPVVEIKKAGTHPNADTLSITQVAGYNVIFKTGDFAVGDRAVYVPEEALVPEDPRWAFLWAHRTNEGKPVREKDRVVRAKRLRGIFSCGLLAKLPPEHAAAAPGTDMVEALGLSKYEPVEVAQTGGDNDPTPAWFPVYTDIENARGMAANSGGVARADRLYLGERVVITEKVHGSNIRFCYHDGRFIVGSHQNTKKQDGKNVWSVVAAREGLEEKAKRVPGVVLFGEVYGGRLQKGYDYGLKHQSLVLFDAYVVEQRRYLDWYDLANLAASLDLKWVPLLYDGPWSSLEHAAAFADGPSVLGGGRHCREGCVVRTVPERWDDVLGRSVLKIIGEEYLLGKGR